MFDVREDVGQRGVRGRGIFLGKFQRGIGTDAILSDLKAKKAQVEDMKKAAPAPAKAKKAEQAL